MITDRAGIGKSVYHHHPLLEINLPEFVPVAA
jgi:hypothetical protein